jgi:putative transposase
MTYDPNKHHRRSIRLSGYDYRQTGAYFITICTHERELLFADPDAARIAERNWAASFAIRKELEADIFIVMPNHIHGIVWIQSRPSPDTDHSTQHTPSVGAQGLRPGPDPTGAQTLRRYCATAAPELPPPDRARLLGRSLGSFVRGYKSSVTRDINAVRGTPDAPVWQRNYYEHIIRNEDSLRRIRQYIRANPARWAFDRDNPNGTPDTEETAFWRTVDTRR